MKQPEAENTKWLTQSYFFPQNHMTLFCVIHKISCVTQRFIKISEMLFWILFISVCTICFKMSLHLHHCQITQHVFLKYNVEFNEISFAMDNSFDW